MSNRRGGIIFIKVDGQQYDAKGNFTYNLGVPNREAIVGADAVHGYSEQPTQPYIEGEITDSPDLDLEKLQSIDEATVTLEVANGKVIMLEGAWYASEGDVQTQEANIALRFEGLSAKEVR